MALLTSESWVAFSTEEICETSKTGNMRAFLDFLIFNFNFKFQYSNVSVKNPFFCLTEPVFQFLDSSVIANT